MPSLRPKEASISVGRIYFILVLLQKSWQKKYCQLFKCSKNGVDRLEVFDSEEDVGKTSNVIITLENCIKISHDAQKHQPHVFAVSTCSAVFGVQFHRIIRISFVITLFVGQVITKCNNNYFSANSEEEMNEWISAFQAVAFKDNISRQTIEEDNDLYCSSGDGNLLYLCLS